MDQSCFQCSKPVPLMDGHFKDVAFNGAQFLLLDVAHSEIYKYDCNSCFLETISLNRSYTSICYDGEYLCYWAIANYSAATIFQLDTSLKEIGQTHMYNAPSCNANNICYDWYRNTLWVSFHNCIGCTEKGCENYTFSKIDEECQSIENILVMPLCRLITLSSCKKESIHVIRPNCKKGMTINIPEGYTLEGTCARISKESCDCGKYCVYILLTEICSQISCIMYCTINCNTTSTPTEEDCYHSCRNELCEIIHSIALEEVGISHILNAEGEKIQKAVACCDTIDELLAVNESVRNTIKQVTLLEIQLTIKLETALSKCYLLS